MKIIRIPKEGASDSKVLINSLSKRNGDLVSSGDVLCEFETSKTVMELESEHDGFVYFLCSEKMEVAVGGIFCIISTRKLSSDEISNIKNDINKPSNPDPDIIITKKAQLLIKKHKINVNQLPHKVISEKVINDYIAKNLKSYKIDYSFKNDDILIYGIGGHAGMCIDILKKDKKYNLVGFIDDNEKKDPVYSLKYFGSSDVIDGLAKSGLKNIILGIGFLNNLKKRDMIYKKLSKVFNIPSIIHPSAIIENTVKIKRGCQIMAGSIIGSNSYISENCIINSGAIISHDTSIGSSSHITPGAVIAGNVNIGKRVILGMCATIYVSVNIADDVIIKNNERITSNI
tara:strand:- start:6402 stop:7433 length:1032 start_codon:yes stop_codon:yes gene_type:complete